MKRIVILFLTFALLLTACGAPAEPVATTAPPDQLVIITDSPDATEQPADATATEPADGVEGTEEAEETEAPEGEATEEAEPTDEAEATEAPAGEATNTPSATGDAIFTDLTRDLDAFSFKCAPSEINFTVKVTDPAVTKVTLFYRVVNKESTTAGAMVTGMDMVNQKDGNFWLNFTATDVKADLRLKNGWFDYQFVGFNKLGQVVGRSEKIVQQVTFTLNCP